ncbi:MAG: S46 family peptidase [Deltaproteobacteria bacterium]|nr:S46 family peptidase [Deltaproteobacteria bacterium]
MMRAVALTSLVLFCPPALADEGMYTFDNPPREALEKAHKFKTDDKWFDHVMQAALRFNNGGSGSFVSRTGLVMTNHHVGFDCIQKLSTPQKDYVKDGYVAAKPEDEAKCPDLELNVLVALEDVTEKVTSAAKGAKNDTDAEKARKKASATVEKECNEKTGHRCNVVALYGGGQYVLHRYRKHTDVRLVFAPEQQMAFFGGDPDNFTYPRYDLDVSFFRVYEEGKPYHPPHHFAWSAEGAADGDLVFVIGNPGSTGRLMTHAQLDFERSQFIPVRLDALEKMVKALKAYGHGGEENLRQVKEHIFGYENSLKAWRWTVIEFKDGSLLARKKKDEAAFVKAAAAKDPKVGAAVRDAIARTAAAQKIQASFFLRRYHSFTPVMRSDLLWRAFTIVQMLEEKQRPNEERFEEYRDSALASLELQLYSNAPIYQGVEKTVLLASFSDASEKLGSNDPFVAAALAGRPEDEVIKKCVEGTKLYDAAFRKEIVTNAGKLPAKERLEYLSKLSDPMLDLALKIEPILRELRKTYEDRVQSVERSQGKRLQDARFVVFGKGVPPDATFTPRITFGTVKGYEAEGTIVAPTTSFYGLFARNADFAGKPPFDLPKRWHDKKAAVDLSVPLNFVSTADIVGGNSGSPVINRNKEIVGIIFDGNIQGFILRYLYSDEKARAVSVHSKGIIEAIRKVYEFGRLAYELVPPPADKGAPEKRKWTVPERVK